MMTWIRIASFPLGKTKQPNRELPLMERIRFTPAQVKTFPDERPDARERRRNPILAQRGTTGKSATDIYPRPEG